MRAVFVVLALLIPAVAAAQNERENLYSTKAIRTFGLALTAGGEFGAPRYTTTLRPTCNTANLGAIIRNTTTNTFQGCDGSSWASIGGDLVSGTTAISGGTDTQVCYNDTGTLRCGDAGLVFNETTNVLSAVGGGFLASSSGAGTPTHFAVPALSLLTGANNHISGSGAGAAVTTGTGNTLYGASAGATAIVGTNNNTCVGFQACLGAGAITSASNTAVGAAALDAMSGTAAQNVALGSGAGGALTSGDDLVALGFNACDTVTNGNGVICVGSGSDSSAGLTDAIAIGRSASVTASNSMVIGGDGSQITTISWGEGLTDSAPLDVTHQATSGSGTNIAGGGFYTAGGRGTGTGNPGEWVAQTSVPGSTGTTLQTLASRLWIEGSQKTLTAGVATAVVRIAVAQGSVTGGVFEYVVRADDGTDFQARSGRLNWQVVNKAGTETCVIGDGTATEAEDGSSIAQSSASTLTYSVTCTSNAADTVDLEINAASGLSETTLRVEQWKLTKHGGVGAITPQ